MLFGEQSFGAAGYTIQSGDTLSMDVNSTGGDGGIAFNAPNHSATVEVYGKGTGSTQHVSYDMSALAGDNLTGWSPALITRSQASDSFLTNASITSNDGTVTPLFTGQALSSQLAQDSCSNTNVSIAAQDIASPETRYFLSDQVGTAQLEVSASGTPLWRGEFAPFGQELDEQFTPNRYKFTGKERDQETGLDYFGARYYQPGLGRFMSPDWSATASPVPYANLQKPQTMNLYAYVGNNPLRQRDSDGHFGLNNDSPGGCTSNKTGSTCSQTEAEQQTRNGVQSQQVSGPSLWQRIRTYFGLHREVVTTELRPGTEEPNSVVALGADALGFASAFPGVRDEIAIPMNILGTSVSIGNDHTDRNYVVNGAAESLGATALIMEGTVVGATASGAGVGLAAGVFVFDLDQDFVKYGLEPMFEQANFDANAPPSTGNPYDYDPDIP